jgi:hypothetical protein
VRIPHRSGGWHKNGRKAGAWGVTCINVEYYCWQVDYENSNAKPRAKYK